MEEIQQYTNKIFSLIQKVTVYYVTNKYKHNFLGNGNDFIYRLRGSIQFRVEAVAWHYTNLQLQFDKAEEEHFSKIKNDQEWEHLYSLLKTQYFLFDDIVFNLLSLFEYTGNLIGYCWKGEQGKSLRWKGMAKSARDPNNEFYKFELAKIISDSDNKLVTKLEDYRANIFHYQNNIGHIGTKIDFPSSGKLLSIDIGVTEKFKKIFKDIEVDTSKNELLGYSKYSIMLSLQIIEEVLNNLLEWPIEPLPIKK